jgi:23S rRNA pseudouridine1911/1915/1917 synthase
MPDNQPSILAETSSYTVVYKPPRMHTVPLSNKQRNRREQERLQDRPASGTPQTLLDWYAAVFPEAKAVCGRQPWEFGVLHRLDFETCGLVLIAKTQGAFDALMRGQEQGLFVKTYRAESAGQARGCGPGFPPRPYTGVTSGCVIESAFRAFGPGRVAVRPVLTPFPKNKDIALDRGAYYKTEILEKTEEAGRAVAFRINLKRGFRHQIRCHLAWLGYPLLNDSLYGIAGVQGPPAPLGLCAVGLAFIDPAENVRVSYTLDDGGVRGAARALEAAAPIEHIG